MMRGIALVVCGLGLVVQVAACGRITRQVRLVADPPAAVAQLWQEPSDMQTRDLFHGPGGSALMPRDAAFATQLAYGALRAQGTLDAVLARLVDRPLAELCSLTGRRAVVTGAGKGLGAQIVRRLAEAGL